MLHVFPLTDKSEKQFRRLFTQYYAELDCEDEPEHLLSEYVLPDLKAGLISVEMLKDGEDYAGFVIYQRDEIDNDWNFREGWGDIREIFVIPEKRRQGLGRFLLYTAEMKLKESGAQKAYALPVDEAEPFFRACGYSAGDCYSEELDCAVYEKLNLNNKCK